jgi:hypothetical protein
MAEEHAVWPQEGKRGWRIAFVYQTDCGDPGPLNQTRLRKRLGIRFITLSWQGEWNSSSCFVLRLRASSSGRVSIREGKRPNCGVECEIWWAPSRNPTKHRPAGTRALSWKPRIGANQDSCYFHGYSWKHNVHQSPQRPATPTFSSRFRHPPLVLSCHQLNCHGAEHPLAVF